MQKVASNWTAQGKRNEAETTWIENSLEVIYQSSGPDNIARCCECKVSNSILMYRYVISKYM